MKKLNKDNSLLIAKRQFDEKKFNELLVGPELELTKRASDEALDRLYLEIQLRNGNSISSAIISQARPYEPIFHKYWYYRLAEMLGIDRKEMDKYVKPLAVKKFFILYVYGRLGFYVLRELKAARKQAKSNDTKLFQYLNDVLYERLQNIALDVYEEMDGKTIEQFKTSYTKKYKLVVQGELF